MVLHHVAQRAGLLVIPAALAHAQLLADRDLEVIDGFAVPEPLEDGVREPEHQDVLHRLLAQVMVDAEDLLLAGVAGQLPVQLARRFQIVAERLLDHHPLPAVSAVLLQQPGAMHLLHHLAELAGRGGEIKEQVPAQRLAAESGELLLQRLISCGGAEIALAIKKVLRELLPDPVVHRLGARELVQRGPQLAAPGGIGLLAPREADDAKGRRHLLLLAEVVQGGDQLARRQVAARAEDDDRARFQRLAPFAQTTSHQLIKLLGLVHVPTIVERTRNFKYSCWFRR